MFINPILVAAAQEVLLPDIVSKYKRALGEVSAIRFLTSYRIKGTTYQQAEAIHFVLYKKAPNLIRYEIEHADREVVQIYDGQHGWQWSPHDPVLEVEPLSQQQIAFMQREAEFQSPLMSYHQLGKSLSYVGRISIRSNPYPVHHLRLTASDNAVIEEIFLDTRTYLEVKRRIDPGDGSPVLETVFEDYRKVKGFAIPFTVSNLLNDELISRTKLADIELNVGVLSFYFHTPKQGKKQSKAFMEQ